MNCMNIDALRALAKVAADLDADAKRDREAGESMYSGGIESYEADDPADVADGLIFAAEFSEKRAAEIRQQIAILATVSEQAPVAWGVEVDGGFDYVSTVETTVENEACKYGSKASIRIVPLYTSPAHTSEARNAAVTDAMVEAALDAQPFTGQNMSHRVWQLMSQAFTDEERRTMMRSALVAAMRQEGGSDA